MTREQITHFCSEQFGASKYETDALMDMVDEYCKEKTAQENAHLRGIIGGMRCTCEFRNGHAYGNMCQACKAKQEMEVGNES